MADPDLDLRIKAALITLTIFGLAIGLAFFLFFATVEVAIWTVGAAALLTVGHFVYLGILDDLRRSERTKARTAYLEREKQSDPDDWTL